VQLQNQVYALSNASNFGVSYSCFGGKKGNVPIVYTLEVVNGKINIFFHSTVPVKNEITGKTDNIHNKTPMGEIKAVPGSLYIQLNEDLLPNKLVFDETKFHWEVLVNSALPYWINKASDLVENNRIAPVWLIIAKLIKLTSYDVMTDLLDIYDVSTVKAFTANQWWDVLDICAREVPSVPQFRNALKGKPVTLNSVDPRFIPCMSSDDQDNRNELLMKYLSSASQSALASATGLKVTQLYNLFSNQAMLVTLCSQHNIDVIPEKSIPEQYVINLNNIGYSWNKLDLDLSTLPDNYTQADLESVLINLGIIPTPLTADDINNIATLPPVK
jgi:hypothetical protein